MSEEYAGPVVLRRQKVFNYKTSKSSIKTISGIDIKFGVKTGYTRFARNKVDVRYSPITEMWLIEQQDN